MIIGFSGYARSGKDSAAQVLVEEYGFRHVSFAKKLKDFLYALDPIVEPLGSGPRLQEVIDQYGWDGVKETRYNDEIRGLLQRVGTDAGRNHLGDNVWVDAAFADIGEGENVVFTDCRFPNEASAIKARGGQLIRVTREGYGPVNGHISEVALDGHTFDWYFYNSATKEDFDMLIRNWAKVEGFPERPLSNLAN
jgi:hypothetical protein